MSDKTRAGKHNTNCKTFSSSGKPGSSMEVDLDQIKHDFGEIVNEKMEAFKASILAEMEKMQSEFCQMLQVKTEEVQELRKEVTNLKSKITLLEDNLDETEAYERRDTIIMSGNIPAESLGENCVELIRQVVKENLKLEIASSDISTAHRIGKKPQAPHLKRNLIVKFCRRDVKRDLISASRNQGKSGQRIYINESLTPQRHSNFHTLRRIRREHPGIINGCTTMDGKVIVYTKPLTNANTRDIKHIVNTREKLVEFCKEYIRVPIENFLRKN